MRLVAPSLDSKSGVTLGGSTVSDHGTWKPVRLEEFSLTSRSPKLLLPRASGAILHIHR